MRLDWPIWSSPDHRRYETDPNEGDPCDDDHIVNTTRGSPSGRRDQDEPSSYETRSQRLHIVPLVLWPRSSPRSFLVFPYPHQTSSRDASHLFRDLPSPPHHREQQEQFSRDLQRNDPHHPPRDHVPRSKRSWIVRRIHHDFLRVLSNV